MKITFSHHHQLDKQLADMGDFANFVKSGWSYFKFALSYFKDAKWLNTSNDNYMLYKITGILLARRHAINP